MGLKVHEQTQALKEKALGEQVEATYTRLKDLYTSGDLSDPDESLRKTAEKALEEAQAAATTGK